MISLFPCNESCRSSETDTIFYTSPPRKDLPYLVAAEALADGSQQDSAAAAGPAQKHPSPSKEPGSSEPAQPMRPIMLKPASAELIICTHRFTWKAEELLTYSMSTVPSHSSKTALHLPPFPYYGYYRPIAALYISPFGEVEDKRCFMRSLDESVSSSPSKLAATADHIPPFWAPEAALPNRARYHFITQAEIFHPIQTPSCPSVLQIFRQLGQSFLER